MFEVKLHGELTFRSVSTVTSTVPLSRQPAILLDLNAVTFARPCGLATLAAWISRTHGLGCTIHVLAERSPAFEYMQNMNLFRLFGVYQQENFNRHPQSGRFARMVRITLDTDTTKLSKELIECMKIDDSDVRPDLLSCLDESIENAWAHARAGPSAYAVGQSFRQGTPDAWYEIAICDAGRGLQAGLSDNSDYEVPDYQTAVDLACKRGISGALHSDVAGYQRHFGLGLWQIDTIASTNRGMFALCSGNACRTRTSDLVVVHENAFWQGTIVSLILSHRGMTERIRTTLEQTRGLRFD